MQYLDEMASNLLPHDGASLSLTAGADPGGPIIIMAVIENGGQMCVADFELNIVGIEILDSDMQPAAFLDIGHWGDDAGADELTGYDVNDQLINNTENT